MWHASILDVHISVPVINLCYNSGFTSSYKLKRHIAHLNMILKTHINYVENHSEFVHIFPPSQRELKCLSLHSIADLSLQKSLHSIVCVTWLVYSARTSSEAGFRIQMTGEHF